MHVRRDLPRTVCLLDELAFISEGDKNLLCSGLWHGTLEVCRDVDSTERAVHLRERDEWASRPYDRFGVTLLIYSSTLSSAVAV